MKHYVNKLETKKRNFLKTISNRFNEKQMSKLPKNFPEYSIMYKSISKQIQQLNLEKNGTAKEEERQKIESKIQTYHKELDKIREMFPEGFFDT